MIDQIRQILMEQGRLPAAESLDPDADLFEAGMSSHASVNVMLAIEDEFDVEFPDALLKRSVFETIDNMAEAIASLTEEEQAA